MNLDILKEYRYRLLSHITIGKTKEHYKRKWKNIKILKYQVIMWNLDLGKKVKN